MYLNFFSLFFLIVIISGLLEVFLQTFSESVMFPRDA